MSDAESGAASAKGAESIRSDSSQISDQFSSRWAYWLSAIGCSVGFGNVWRFPYLIYDYGGAAFFIPYLMALFLVVIPVSLLEFGFGQMTQRGLPSAMNSVHDRSRAASWGFMTCFNVLTFYQLLLCWSLIYMVNSFPKNLGWVVTDEEEAFCDAQENQLTCLSNVACQWENDDCSAAIVSKAVDFFQRNCNINTDPAGSVTRYSWEILLGILFLWTAAFAAVIGGARIMGYISYITMSLPILFLLVLVIVGSTLSGASDGIKLYIGQIDFNKLTGEVWSAALAQAIFSMGAVQGSMCGFAAHNRKDQNFYADTWMVVFGDTFFAFLAGFAVFAVAGHLAHDAGIPMSELELAGSSLVFQTYPVGLSASIPYPWCNMLSFFFFMTLWLLGFTTVVGLLEAQIMPWMDSEFCRKRGLGRKHITGILCVIFALLGQLFCLDMGNHLLDAIDYFSAYIATVYFCFAFSIAGGWIAGSGAAREVVGDKAFFTHAITWNGGVFISALIGFALEADIGKIVGPCMGAAIMGGGYITAIFMANKEDEEGKRQSIWRRTWNLSMHSVEMLREGMNAAACRGDDCACACCTEGGACCCGGGCGGCKATCANCAPKLKKMCEIPMIWSWILRYFVPVAASIMLSLEFTRKDGTFNQPSKERPYTWWILMIGCFGPFSIMILSMTGFIFPKYMDFLLPLPESRPKLGFIHPEGFSSSGGKGETPATPPLNAEEEQFGEPDDTVVVKGADESSDEE